jgi:hypothetical protein
MSAIEPAIAGTSGKPSSNSSAVSASTGRV